MLEQYGWSDALRHSLAPFAAQGMEAGRVISVRRGACLVVTARGETLCRGSSTLHHHSELPVTGDWVALSSGRIQHILPRRSLLARQAADASGTQKIAANVDLALLLSAMTEEFNPRRLERFLAMIWSSGATPLLLLTKADLAIDQDSYLAQARGVAPGVEIIPLSSLTGAGIECLRPHLLPGRTCAMLGASGVGKSTLLNQLAGADWAKTGAVSALGDKGRHTTTGRHLHKLPGGALLIDMPGMKTLGLTASHEDVARAFADVEALSRSCRFHDCRHDSEPGCAVLAARASGALPEARWAGFVKLRREAAFARRREDPVLRQAERTRWQAVTKAGRARRRHKADEV